MQVFPKVLDINLVILRTYTMSVMTLQFQPNFIFKFRCSCMTDPNFSSERKHWSEISLWCSLSVFKFVPPPPLLTSSFLNSNVYIFTVHCTRHRGWQECSVDNILHTRSHAIKFFRPIWKLKPLEKVVT